MSIAVLLIKRARGRRTVLHHHLSKSNFFQRVMKFSSLDQLLGPVLVGYHKKGEKCEKSHWNVKNMTIFIKKLRKNFHSLVLFIEQHIYGYWRSKTQCSCRVMLEIHDSKSSWKVQKTQHSHGKREETRRKHSQTSRNYWETANALYVYCASHLRET